MHRARTAAGDVAAAVVGLAEVATHDDIHGLRTRAIIRNGDTLRGTGNVHYRLCKRKTRRRDGYVLRKQRQARDHQSKHCKQNAGNTLGDTFVCSKGSGAHVDSSDWDVVLLPKLEGENYLEPTTLRGVIAFVRADKHWGNDLC